MAWLADKVWKAQKAKGKGRKQVPLTPMKNKGKKVVMQPAFLKQILAVKGKGKSKNDKHKATAFMKQILAAKGKGKSDKQKATDDKYREKLKGIDAEQKVWVGGLADKTTWKGLEKHVVEVTGSKPSVTDVRKGKACLAFASADKVADVIASLNGTTVDGSVIEADVWTKPDSSEKKKQPKQKPLKVAKAVIKSASSKKVIAAKGKGKSDKQKAMDEKIREKLKGIDAEQKVWVGGLADKTTWKQLDKHVVEVTGSKPSVTDVRKGKACLAFASADKVADVIASLNGTTVDGNVIEADVWTKPDFSERKERKQKKKGKTV